MQEFSAILCEEEGQVYRDVRSVDRKPVCNRDDRLKTLFLEGSKRL